MSRKKQNDKLSTIVKVVYFDEETASDYLDIVSGGRSGATAEEVKERSEELHGKLGAQLAAKLSWLPLLGASSTADVGASATASGSSILRKTLSNTILTDYLPKALKDDRILQLHEYRVSAPRDSMAYIKMFTPYMAIMRTEETGVDLAKLDQALAEAKGYYELLGKKGSEQVVLRFNLRAFRNNYGLADLLKMDLVFHVIKVGRTHETSLTMEAEMGSNDTPDMTATDIVDGPSNPSSSSLTVYDVVFVGVEHAK